MEISSAPYLIDPVTFGLKDEEKNHQKLAELKQHRSVEMPAYGILPLTEYFISKTESYIVAEYEGLIVYLVHLVTHSVPHFPLPVVTQVAVWRTFTLDTPLDGLASFIFKKVILPRHKVIVSDDTQTEKGRDFWIKRMYSCHRDGLKVGVFDYHAPDIDWAPAGAAFNPWMRIKEPEGWGYDPNTHPYIRFVIALK
jgi:hypothetical protein